MIRVIFFVGIIVATFAVDSIKGNSCVTPLQENATCAAFLNCAVITSALGTPQGLQFAKDSQCGCDMGMVCCGTLYNQSYSPSVNCSHSPQLAMLTMSSASDKASPNAKETTGDLLKGKSCVTPYGEDATCVPYSNCKVILSVIGTEEGDQLWNDSKCSCGAEMVCCGTYNNVSYTPFINCTPPAEPEDIFPGLISDGSICGLDSSTDRIIGGRVVKTEELPWMAALEYQTILTKENVGFRCGGSIITARYILTAAHCMVHVEFMIIKVWLGVTNITLAKHCANISDDVKCINTVQKMNVEEIFPHEFYNSIDNLNDIGLLLLENDIKFSKYARPICLPSPGSESPRIESYLTVAGWGATENGTSSEIKLKVEVPLKHNNVCNEYLKNHYKEITSKQLCAGGKRGKDSCRGDSGGPLMYKVVGLNHDVQWYQQGIVSYGIGCGTPGKPGIYVKVSSYDKWIYNKIQNVIQHVGEGEPCRAANSSIGTCVKLRECKEVLNAAFAKGENGFRVVSESNCADQYAGFVCCQNPSSIIIPNWNSTALPDKTTCGILKNKPRNDGTEIKDLAVFPWVAGIEHFSKEFSTTGIKCIGTVINSRYVLTSAGCILRKEFVPVNVWLGHWNTSAYNGCQEVDNTVNCTNPVQSIKIKTTIIHQFFEIYKLPYDIALVSLETEIRFSDYISPICLPSPNLPKLKLGKRMTILKWNGEDTREFITSSDMMLKDKIPVVSNDECWDTHFYYNDHNIWATKLSETELPRLCAGHQDKNPCDRFIGAPFMRSYKDKPNGKTQWYLEGLVNTVSDECNNRKSEDASLHKYLRSYTRVANYLNFVISIISED